MLSNSPTPKRALLCAPNLFPQPRGRGDAGVFAVLATVLLTALFGFLALAADAGWIYTQRRRIQTAADAAAIYAAQNIRRGQKDTTTVEAGAVAGASDNGFTAGQEGVQVNVEYPPMTGGYGGNALAVTVTVCQPQPAFFMPIFNVWSTDVCAKATAGYLARAEGCIYALNPTMEKAMHVHSNSNLVASCGVVVNSQNPGGLYVASSACLQATSVGVTASNYYADGSCSGFANQVSPDPVTLSPPQPDPLAHLNPPTEIANGCWQTDFVLDKPEKVQFLQPNKKWCKGLKIDCPVSVCGVINLPAGNYVIAGKRLEIVGSQTKVTGDGVMFYATDWPGQGLQSEGILIGSGATVDFSAPTSGDYEAILMYVDRNLPFHKAKLEISSGVSAKLSGALYAYNQNVLIHSDTSGNSLSGNGIAIVGDTVEVTSGAKMYVPSDFSGFPGGSPIKTVALLE